MIHQVGPGLFPCQRASVCGDREGMVGTQRTALAPLQVSRTPSPVLGCRSLAGGLGQGWAPPFLPVVIPPQLGEHPQPPQCQAGGRGGGVRRAACGCGCPSLIHCQIYVTTPRKATGGWKAALEPSGRGTSRARGGRVTCRGAGPGERVPRSMAQLASCEERK